MALSDEDLVNQCLNGEDSAYGFLVDKYKGAVHSLARKKLGNYHDAEEVAQEAFLKAYQNLPSLREPKRFAGWLYVITANECSRRLKKRAQEEASLHSMEELAHQQEASEYTTQQMKRQLHDAIDALPEAEQTIIHLHHFGGLTCEEISRFLGTSRNAVKMRLSRARAQLKKEVTEMLDQKAGVISLPMQFTLKIMERIEQMRFLPPRRIHPNPLGRLIPVGTLLLAALVIGLGMFSQKMTIPPISWEGAREIDVPLELLNVPNVGESLQIGRTTQEADGSLVQEGKLEPSPITQRGNDVSGLAALAGEDDENPHVSGIVVSKQTGQPIPNAVIYIGSREVYRKTNRELKQSMTDAWGQFRLNAEIADKTIGVRAKGYGFQFVHFPEGQKVVDGLHIELEPGVQVTGNVVDTAGAPIANALVYPIVGLSFGRGSLMEGTYTDENGRYVLSDLSPMSPYLIAVTHPQYKDHYGTPPFISALQGTEAPTIVMEPGLPSPHIASLAFQEEDKAEQIITGITVWGAVSAENGAPIAKATVRIGRAGSDPQAVVTETDDQGNYRAENVLAGPLHLLVSMKGFSPFHEPIDTRAGKSFERNVTLTKSPILEGVVVDELTGNPLSQVKVLFGPWYHNKQRNQEPVILDFSIWTTTDAKGQFTYDEIPQEGFFKLQLVEGGRGVLADEYRYDASIQRFIHGFGYHPVQTPIVLKLKRRAHVQVRVVDAITETPIPNFYVSLHFPRNSQNPVDGMGSEWFRETEQGGIYIYAKDGLFVGPLAGENTEMTLSFVAEGYAPGVIERAVNRVQPEIITLRLEKEKVLHGKVVDADTGAPIENAWVKAFSWIFPLQLHSGKPEAMGGVSDLSNAKGEFTLHQMGHGKNAFYVQHPDYAPAIFLDQEFSDQEAAVVKLGQGGTVAGTAPPETQVAIEFAEHLYDKEPPGERPYFELIFMMKTDIQGQFRFERLPPGKYYLAIAKYDHPRLEVERIDPTRTVHLIEVQEGAVIRRDLP